MTCDTVVYEKKYLFGLCPPLLAQELLKALEFPK